jgi:hypothetical protein
LVKDTKKSPCLQGRRDAEPMGIVLRKSKKCMSAQKIQIILSQGKISGNVVLVESQIRAEGDSRRPPFPSLSPRLP